MQSEITRLKEEQSKALAGKYEKGVEVGSRLTKAEIVREIPSWLRWIVLRVMKDKWNK